MLACEAAELQLHPVAVSAERPGGENPAPRELREDRPRPHFFQDRHERGPHDDLQREPRPER